MVDKIVELENGFSYVVLDKKIMDNRVFYYGLRLEKDDEPTNNYLFFEEFKSDDGIILLPIVEDELKGLLVTVFTINLLDKAYDM